MADKQKKIKIVQKASAIGRSVKQQGCLKGLGLGKVGSVSVLVETPAVLGMINKVAHMVEVSEAE